MTKYAEGKAYIQNLINHGVKFINQYTMEPEDLTIKFFKDELSHIRRNKWICAGYDIMLPGDNEIYELCIHNDGHVDSGLADMVDGLD